MRPTLGPALTAFVFLGLTAAAEGALTHRYSFNDGTAADSVGAAHGVPINGARIADGRADLANRGFNNNPLTGQYIDLPNQIARTPALTLEAWVTYRSRGLFEEIVSIGTGSAGELQPGTPNTATGGVFGTDYVAIIPTFNNGFAGTIRGRDVIEQPLTVAPPLPLGGEHHVAYVVDFPNRAAALYLDGLEVGRRTISIDPSLHDQVNNWLGRSQWSPDTFFDGSINEFRIYDNALSGAEVAQSFARGPNAVPEPAGLSACLLAGILLARRRR